MKNILIAIMFLLAIASPAEAGKNSRPSYSPSYRPPVVHNNTTVIHHDSGGSGFMMGYLLGHANNQPQTVIVHPPAVAAPVQPVAPQPPATATPAQPAPAVTSVTEESGSIFDTLLYVLLGLFAFVIGIHYIKNKGV